MVRAGPRLGPQLAKLPLLPPPQRPGGGAADRSIFDSTPPRRRPNGKSEAGGPALAPALPELRALRRGDCFVLAPPPLAGEALRLGLLEPGGLVRVLAAAERGPAGRAPTACVTLSDVRRLHLRPVHHGGLLAPLWRGRLLGIARSVRELRVAARLAAAGAPVTRPALVAGERRRGLWRAALATWHEGGALDASAWLAREPEPARLLRAAAAAGAALRRFHEAGGRHRDLHAGNLLLREGAAGIEVLLVDLDRARCGSPPGPAARLAEVMRLYRSLLKRGLAARVGPRGCAAFLRAYTGGDRRLRRALLRHLPRERRRLALHRIGYRIAAAVAGARRALKGASASDPVTRL
jgi:hypothetical protein